MNVFTERHVDPSSLAASLRRDVFNGLTVLPKTLPSKWFYDERGGELFDQITRLPEYYPTRAERSLLVTHAPRIAELSGADTLVELGSGTSEKTRLLLSALHDAATLRRFVPFDVDESAIRAASYVIATAFDGLAVHAVVGDFEHHLSRLPRGGRRMIAFLGSTIGNLEPAPRARFLATVRSTMNRGDTFLLGTDLVKDPSRLVAAYDDDAGVTADFNRNILMVINRELKADFDPTEFEHVAVWDPQAEWIEMRLRSRRSQVVTIAGLDLEVPFAAGEELRTEISAKFRRHLVELELAGAGLRVVEWFSDPGGDFGLSLSTPQ
jgi:L-histidine N-alpha-methyltransferase